MQQQCYLLHSFYIYVRRQMTGLFITYFHTNYIHIRKERHRHRRQSIYCNAVTIANPVSRTEEMDKEEDIKYVITKEKDHCSYAVEQPRYRPELEIFPYSFFFRVLR